VTNEERLWHGVKKGDISEVAAALEQGADANCRDKIKRTPLMEAAKRGRLPILELLLDGGADVNAQDFSGETPLMSAIAPHQLAAVQLLVASGAAKPAADGEAEKCVRKIRHQQIVTCFSTLFSIVLFLYGQRRIAKDKELQQIECIEMAFKVYGEIVTLQKYQRMARIIKKHVAEDSDDN